jgi:hypothetical protein
MVPPSFVSGLLGLVYEASAADRLMCPTPPSAREMMQRLRLLRVVLELFLVQSGHICLGVEVDLLDRRRTAHDAQVDPSGRVDGGGWMTGVA